MPDPVRIPLARLLSTVPAVPRADVRKALANGITKPPTVEQTEAGLVIREGHAELVARWLAGDEEAACYVVTKVADDAGERLDLMADILAGLLGPAALHLWDGAAKGWDPAQHPRDPETGRFLSVGEGAVTEARSKIAALQGMADGPEKLAAGRDLAKHLFGCTNAQLRQLKDEHGLAATSGAIKSELVNHLASHFEAPKKPENIPSPAVDKPSPGGYNPDSGAGTPPAPISQEKPAMTEPVKIDARVQEARNGRAYIEITPHSGLHEQLAAAEQISIGGRTYTVSGYGEEYRASGGGTGFRRRAYLEEVKAPPVPGSITVERRSSTRSVDAYAMGSLYKHEGSWYVVDGYSRTQDDHGGYTHSLALRPANEQEQKQGRAGELRAELRAMGPGPDDDRDRPAHEARRLEIDEEIRKLEGRPSRAEEAAEAAKPKQPNYEARRPALAALGTSPTGRSEAHWQALADAMNDIQRVAKRNILFTAHELQNKARWSEEEIQAWFQGEDLGNA